MPTSSVLVQYLAPYLGIGYPLIFIATMFEGDIILFTTGFLTQQGLFSIIYTPIVVFFGALAGDLLWYWFGYELNKLHISISLVRRWMERLSGPIDEHLINRTTHTVFISKFAYGFNHLTLMRAGMLGIKLKAFIKANMLATLAWMLVVGGLGYASGESFALFKRYLRYGEFALLGAVITFFLFWHFVVTKRLEREL